MDGISKFESEVSQKFEKISAQYNYTLSHMANKYLYSTLYIPRSSLKVSAGMIYCH